MDWEKIYNESCSYIKTANGAMKTKRLGNTVVYNLVSLAVENLLTALLMRDSMLPEHSSIGSMLRELKKTYDVPDSFFESSRLLNKYMNFCSLEVMPTLVPSDGDIEKMCFFMNDLKIWIDNQLTLVSKIG